LWLTHLDFHSTSQPIELGGLFTRKTIEKATLRTETTGTHLSGVLPVISECFYAAIIWQGGAGARQSAIVNSLDL